MEFSRKHRGLLSKHRGSSHLKRKRVKRPHGGLRLEGLESRVLLNGLTIITHGAEFISTARPLWIDQMADAIIAQAGAGTSVYALRLQANSSNQAYVAGFARIYGSAQNTSASANGQTILLFDWAAVANNLTQSFNTADLAKLLIPYITTAQPSVGLTAPLAEGAIQLIGHSRGASMVSEIAKDLAAMGIWVDQLTTLDPRPVPPDPYVSLESNIIFADNYYQTSGNGTLVPNGMPISGAANFGPLTLGGAYSSLFGGGTHSDVHLFYDGSIDLSSSAGSEGYRVQSAWYPNNGLDRATTGWYYSLLGGGTRPASGIGTMFGGTGARVGYTRALAQWANIALVSPSATTLAPGEAFSASFDYQSFAASASVQWYLDTDQNPYDAGSIALGGAVGLGSTSNSVVAASSNLTAAGAEGTYYLEAKITDGTHTRYAYSGQAITLLDRPVALISGHGQAIASGDTTPSAADGTDFGTIIAVAGSQAETYTLLNNGTLPLNLTDPALVTVSGTEGADFVLTTPPGLSTLNPGDSTSFTITWTASHAGVSTAVVTVASNDPGNPAYHFSVKGTLTPPQDLSGFFAATLSVPGALGAGDKFSVPVTITNTGWIPASGVVSITVKASADGLWHDGDAVLGARASQTINLAKNGSGTYTVPVTVPAGATLAAGSYTLVAKVNVVSGFVEQNTANNVIVAKGSAAGPVVAVNVVVAKPDLTLAFGAAAPNFSTYVPGDWVTLPLTVRNIGIRSAVGTALAPIKIDVYDDADKLITQFSLASTIARGGSLALTVRFQLPVTIAPGSFFVVAKADTTNVVDELDEKNNTAATGAKNIVWQFGNIAGRPGSTALTFKDGNGTLVTLRLTGPGVGQLSAGAGGFDIGVTGSTVGSGLSITTVKTATVGDDGRFTLHDLTVGDPLSGADHTALGTITARTTDLAGDMTVTGPVKNLYWGNVAGQHVISIGAPAVGVAAANLTFGAVQNLTLDSAVGINLLQATNWADTDGTPDIVIAPWVGRLVITGDRAHGLAGDFQAGLTLTAAAGASAAAATLTAASIAGGVGGTTWDIAGKAGTVSIAGAVGTVGTAWTMMGFTGASSLTLGDVVNGYVTTAGDIGTVKVKRWQAGGLSARTLNILQATGLGGAAGYAGDFLAGLTLSGPVNPALVALNTATISGSVGAATWEVHGKVGRITIGSTTGQVATPWQLTDVTSASYLSLGDVTNAVVAASGDVGTVAAKRWAAGSLTAKSLSMLQTTGLAAWGAFSGDFGATVTLAGPGVGGATTVLNSVQIAGHITGGVWGMTGTVNLLTARAIDAGWQGRLTGATGNLNTVRLTDAAAASTLDVVANRIGTMTVSGTLLNSLITLNQAVSATVAGLGTLTVTGDIRGTAIRSAGNITTVRARTLSGTLLFAGVQPGLLTRPATAGDFVDLAAANLPTIGTLTLTGIPGTPAVAVFTDSEVAAGKIVRVALPSANPLLIDPSGAATSFGFATRVGNVGTYVGPASSGLYISGKGSLIS